MSRHLLVKSILLLYFFGTSCWTSLFAQSTCDPALPGIKEGGLGYRDRGDRCEGLYINPVSNTTLFVASFTEQFENYDNTGNTILIEWSKPPSNHEIHLRAQGIRPRLYYRMDAYKPGTNSFFAWPAGILSSLNIKRNDIGVTGKVKLLVGETEKYVHLPLRIRKQGESKRTGTYKLILLPGVQLTEIFVSLASVGEDGQPQRFLKTDEALGYGYYPAERPVEVPIPAPADKGVYYLKLGAKIKSGGTKAIEFWFYNP
jgi:hypothetical protein